jgi:hypothetical protein
VLDQETLEDLAGDAPPVTPDCPEALLAAEDTGSRDDKDDKAEYRALLFHDRILLPENLLRGSVSPIGSCHRTLAFPGRLDCS